MVLGLDTCLNACSVAVLDGARVLAFASETMARGHQERLAPMAQAVMVEAGLPFNRLRRIGATVGPGSFTGLRVGVAFAKGLASALSIPAVGVGSLEALATEAQGLVAAVLDARREQVYLQVFEAGAPLMAPDVLPLGVAAARLAELARGRPLTLVGSGAPLLADATPDAAILIPDGCDARQVARLAAARAPTPIHPLYLRAPDARLPGGKLLA
ncbi:tRNA (adenosine(37)-N6)-threonylcarbamoyltransferase complex dimerization subunit type 1 TsaB [Phenylobacterium sp.]|uniref:tRNA (adenosine(37)-N6)-threonylcarbamoyltransferase complex dimerization subunit type 1 TsaB n=1 Tax=Phenylobacterium sp. TaxID=1871053 RepID=UPI0025EEA5F4|nr:tRNA (adenosine(37)-N6)-threonylcarbamoyltransferase complex dimerization subunit type 1 TsaB [Phenylobacterium sp.]